jgi:hypothetical protein
MRGPEKKELDGAYGFTFEEFVVGSDTEGFQQAGLHFLREGVDLVNAEACVGEVGPPGCLAERENALRIQIPRNA